MQKIIFNLKSVEVQSTWNSFKWALFSKLHGNTHAIYSRISGVLPLTVARLNWAILNPPASHPNWHLSSTFWGKKEQGKKQKQQTKNNKKTNKQTKTHTHTEHQISFQFWHF